MASAIHIAEVGDSGLKPPRPKVEGLRLASAIHIAEVGDDQAIADHFGGLKPCRKITCTFGRPKIGDWKRKVECGE